MQVSPGLYNAGHGGPPGHIHRRLKRFVVPVRGVATAGEVTRRWAPAPSTVMVRHAALLVLLCALGVQAIRPGSVQGDLFFKKKKSKGDDDLNLRPIVGVVSQV